MNSNVDELVWCLERGLRVDYLGDWYRFDKRGGVIMNITRRCLEVNNFIRDFVRSAKLDPSKKIDANILLEHEHLGAFLHNNVSHIYTDAGLRHNPVDLSKINMEYIVKRYGAILE